MRSSGSGIPCTHPMGKETSRNGLSAHVYSPARRANIKNAWSYIPPALHIFMLWRHFCHPFSHSTQLPFPIQNQEGFVRISTSFFCECGTNGIVRCKVAIPQQAPSGDWGQILFGDILTAKGGRLTFRNRASCIYDRRFATFYRTLFIYLINKYISLSDIYLTEQHWYKQYRQPIRCNNNGLLKIPVS